MNFIFRVTLLFSVVVLPSCQAHRASISNEKGTLEAFGLPYIRVYVKNEEKVDSDNPGNPKGCNDLTNSNCVVYKVICQKNAEKLKDALPKTTQDSEIFDETTCDETPGNHAEGTDAVLMMPLPAYAWVLGKSLGIDSTVPGPTIPLDALNAQLNQLQLILKTAEDRPIAEQSNTNRQAELKNIQQRVTEQQRIIAQYPNQLPLHETVRIFTDFIKLPQIQSAARVLQVSGSGQEFGTVLLSPFKDVNAAVRCQAHSSTEGVSIPVRGDGKQIGGYYLSTRNCPAYVKSQKFGLMCASSPSQKKAIVRIATDETVTEVVNQDWSESADCIKKLTNNSTIDKMCVTESNNQFVAISTTAPIAPLKTFGTLSECMSFIVGPPVTP